MAITLQEVGTDGIDGTDTGRPRPPSLIPNPDSELQEFADFFLWKHLTEKHLLPPQRSDVDSTGDPPAFFC